MEKIKLSETDNTNIKDIISRIHQEMGNNAAFVELLDSQAQAVRSKGPTGHHWVYYDSVVYLQFKMIHTRTQKSILLCIS